ncbi:hypothetical protein ACJJTC_006125 [Scirpophaga incertulas]
MALQLTQQDKCQSDTNIPSSVDRESVAFNNNSRKRKQHDNELDFLNERFDRQLTEWDKQIQDCMTSTANAVITTEMAKMSAVLYEINNNLLKLNADSANTNKILKDNSKKLNDIEKSLQFVSERQEVLDNRLLSVEAAVSRVGVLENKINGLEYKLSTMEQQARHCNIEISNMLERRGENLLSTVEMLGDLIKCPIRSMDVVAIHRVPHADQKNSRPKNIIIKLTSRILRDNILSAYRACAKKGLDSSQLSIAEAAKKHEFKFVWVKHGVILVRKSETSPIFAIRCSDDISKIK